MPPRICKARVIFIDLDDTLIPTSWIRRLLEPASINFDMRDLLVNATLTSTSQECPATSNADCKDKSYPCGSFYSYLGSILPSRSYSCDDCSCGGTSRTQTDQVRVSPDEHQTLVTGSLLEKLKTAKGIIDRSTSTDDVIEDRLIRILDAAIDHSWCKCSSSCEERGHAVCIVTNARGTPWIHSLLLAFPGLVHYMRDKGVPVIRTTAYVPREVWNELDHPDIVRAIPLRDSELLARKKCMMMQCLASLPGLDDDYHAKSLPYVRFWTEAKRRIFAHIVRCYRRNVSQIEVLSIGDAEFEHYAALQLTTCSTIPTGIEVSSYRCNAAERLSEYFNSLRCIESIFTGTGKCRMLSVESGSRYSMERSLMELLDNPRICKCLCCT